MVYQEKTDFFRKISAFNPSFTDLCDLVRTVDLELEGGSTVEKYLEELWSLGTCYEDFILAYERLLKEIERRQNVATQHASVANQYNQHLAALYDEEIQQREKFIDSIAPFLPGDLSLSLNTAPALFTVTQAQIEASYCMGSSLEQKEQGTIQLSVKEPSSENEMSASTGEDDQSVGAVYESAPESQSDESNKNRKPNSSKASAENSPPAPFWD
ncbi:hypothetical protein DSO57_1016488 [Entomophthora muscae]|uniref:Uncharacterized protein n=1 Tax=Entomophthora muscae TaxID=34485 RepID=A0ACC2TFY7_9FUNG|nr:hypothetical protein DSO57_1016488 [Entomophthora muscae]